MRCLKIDNNKGHYSLDGIKWIEIDKISKDDLLILINILIDSEMIMDPFDKDKLGNQAHQIIYKNVYDKFLELSASKNKFKDESETTYKAAIEKYSS